MTRVENIQNMSNITCKIYKYNFKFIGHNHRETKRRPNNQIVENVEPIDADENFRNYNYVEH